MLSGFMLRRDAAERFLALCDTMTALRAKDGCPWDREQTVKTLRSYLLEETHEVLDVLDSLDDDGGGPRVGEHRDELGDLMLQIVFQSEIQREHARFDVGDVCEAINAKLIRRHPHLFGQGGERENWEALKRKERGAEKSEKKSALDGVPKHLPALLRAYRTGEKAHGAGFDWPDHHGVVEKIEEEVGELKEALQSGDKDHIAHEIGDLLYAVVNLARHKEIDAEGALRKTIARFESRFRLVEDQLAAEGKIPEKTPLAELEEKWQRAKKLLADQER
jgi:tetrapyrrole methylase family protein/MazG family protein